MSLSVSACEEKVKELRASSSRFKSLLAGIKADVTVSCRPCSLDNSEGSARALLKSWPLLEIVLCTNRLEREKVEEVFVHELVHAYDYTNGKCNFDTCMGLAYSEVRAAREAECAGYFPFEWLKTQCIRHRATKSTANLFKEKDQAAKCVDAVLKEAIADKSPFS